MEEFLVNVNVVEEGQVKRVPCVIDVTTKDTESGVMAAAEVLDIFSFPDEILSIVFEYVSQVDLVRSRLVSERWKRKIDTLVSFRIKLNDSQPQLLVQQMLGLRVRSCEIVHLKLPFVAAFQNPLFVKEIIFTNSSKENVTTLLRICTDLEKIAFFTTFLGDKFFDLENPSEELYRLKKLKEIEVGIQVFNAKGSEKSSVFQTIFGNSQLVFPSLRRLFVHYPMNGCEWLDLFQFISRHVTTLKCLKLRCFECPQGMSEVPATILVQLVKLNLLTLEIICNCSCSEYSPVHRIFSEVVASQESLETLVLDFHKCPLQAVKDVVFKSSQTLQYLKLCQLEFGHEDDLQGSMFSKCIRLRELKFHCLPRVIVYVSLDLDTDPPPPKPIAKGAETFGWSFPKCLKQFGIKGCHIPTEELLSLNCRTLEHLELYEVGTSESYGYGLTQEAFVNLCENLSNLELFTFRTVSFSAPEKVLEETLKWQVTLVVGKDLGVFRETPCDCSDLYRTRRRINDNENCKDETDLTRLITFRFVTTAQRETFLKRVEEAVSSLDDSEGNGERSRLEEIT